MSAASFSDASKAHSSHVRHPSASVPASAAATAAGMSTSLTPPPPPSVAAAVGGSTLAARFELLGRIGEGTYGVVYLAAERSAPLGAKRLFAIKTFKSGREGDGISPTAVREILLLRELRHVHIVRLHSVHINRSEPSLSLAFEYAEHDLYEMLWYHRDRLNAPMPAYTAKSVMWQLLDGLAFLHRNWVLHRDLKPSNVLVTGDGPEAGCVQIADFGLARSFQAPLRPLSDNGVVVTIWYRAPELLLGAAHYTRAVDVWAAGCIMAELLTLRPLFQGAERKQVGAPFQLDQLDRMFRVLGAPQQEAWPLLAALPHWRDNTEGVRAPRPEWGANVLGEHLVAMCRHAGDGGRGSQGGVSASVSAAAVGARPTPAAVSLLQRMLDYNPQRRITAEEALQHEFFTAEAPAPGHNVFSFEGTVLMQYPRRSKHAALVGAGAAGAAPTSSAAGGQPQAPVHAAPSAAAQSATARHVHEPVNPPSAQPGRSSQQALLRKRKADTQRSR